MNIFLKSIVFVILENRRCCSMQPCDLRYLMQNGTPCSMQERMCLTTNVTKSGTICLHVCASGRGYISLCKESGNKACLILPLQPAGKGNINVSSLLKAMTQILLTTDQLLNKAITVCLGPIWHFWLVKKSLRFFLTIIPIIPIIPDQGSSFFNFYSNVLKSAVISVLL